MDPILATRITVPAAIAQPESDRVGDGQFADLVRAGMDRLGELEKNADQQVRALLAGEPVELHRVVMAGEEAGLAFELMMSIRNKALEAYQEVMRMQV